MYWDNTNSNTLKISDIGHYTNFPHMTSTIPEGYNCDPLQHTPILFMGSCDLDGPTTNTDECWARLLHTHIVNNNAPIPYIALAKMTAGFVSFPRRLLTFCEKYGPPEKLYAVVPRPVAIEIPMLNGELVSISNRESFAQYLLKHNRISNEEHDTLLAASKFCQSQLNNNNYQLYQFEQTASFIQLICKQYNISFQWTLNLSASAIAYYDKFFITFMENNQFMSNTFAGPALAIDFSFDGSMGDTSHHEVFKVFSCNTTRYRDTDTISALRQNLITANARTSAIQRSM